MWWCPLSNEEWQGVGSDTNINYLLNFGGWESREHGNKTTNIERKCSSNDHGNFKLSV